MENDDWLRGPLRLLRWGTEEPPFHTLCRVRQYVCLQRLRQNSAWVWTIY